MNNKIGACLLTGMLLQCTGAMAEETATPYRPTVANPAELSAPGWLEIEAGWDRTRADGETRNALPYTLKYAFDSDWGVLLGGELWARDGAADVSGLGDTALLLKHRIATGSEDVNFGFEVGMNLPTSRDGLGSNKADWIANGIYSWDFAEDWRLDMNLGVTRQGDRSAGISRIVNPWAACVSHGLDRWTLAGEISGEHQEGVSDVVQGLVAASYAVTPRLVLDVGYSHANQGGEGQQSVFFGLTWLAQKVR